MKTFEERFWEKVDKTGDCWLWTASKQPSGYGQFRVPGGVLLAHRVAYELSIGPIPEGLHIDHLCLVRGCVNPTHLEVVTIFENSRRQGLRRKTCIRGHSFTEANTYWRPDGLGRQCKACIRIRAGRSA